LSVNASAGEIMFKVIEKANPLAVHAHCSGIDGATRWITVNAPAYCAKGYFMDKTLTPESFAIYDTVRKCLVDMDDQEQAEGTTPDVLASLPAVQRQRG
jgi:hypothetical protein